jgi:prepilin-type N-terminal cleavage/methylation domain-containing protein
MNRRGFSLIEVMIAMGILSIVMLASAQMFTQIFAQQRGMNQSFDLLQFIETVDGITRNSPTCQPTLIGQPFNPVTPTAVVYTDPSGPITVGTRIGTNGSLIVDTVMLTSVALTAPNQYLAELSFTVDKTGQVVGPKTLTRKIRLQVSVLAGLVTDCFSSSDVTLAKVCASILGTFNPVTQICSPIP